MVSGLAGTRARVGSSKGRDRDGASLPASEGDNAKESQIDLKLGKLGVIL